MKRKLTRVIGKSSDGYIAYIREVPGVNTQGWTLAEVRASLKEALALILEVNRKLRRR
jgi:predicted RNase H-like HicB family nuclease